MRVLYASHTAIVSGAERTLLDLLEALPEDVEAVVASPEGDLAERVRRAGVEWLELPGTSGSLRLHPVQTPVAVTEMARSAMRLRRLARRVGADVVHANSVRAGLIAIGVKAPVVVHVHDRLEPGRVTALIGRVLRARTDAFLSISAWAEAGLEGQWAPVHRVGNPVDLDRFRVPNAPPSGPPTLGLVAQITQWKGQLEAIEALALIRERVPDARLALVGAVKFAEAGTRYDNRAYYEQLLRRRSELGLEDAVDIVGEREDVAALMPTFSALLVASWGEPFGRSMIEAMACGVPVVATDVGGPSEVITSGEAGVLVPPRDPQAMADAVVALLADEFRRREIGDAGRRIVETRFEKHAYAAHVAAIYGSVLSGIALRRA